MAATRILTRGINGAPFSLWTGASAGDIAVATLFPEPGDHAYRSDTSLLYVYAAGAWTAISSAGAAGGQPVFPPDVAAPNNDAEVATSTTFTAANQFRGARVIIPKTGTLHDLSVYVQAPSGNVRGAIYDVGATTSAIRTRVWHGASMSSGAGFSWVNLGDPALAVTVGQHLDFSVGADNGSVSLGRRQLQDTNVGKLPANFGTVLGCSFWQGWLYNAGSLSAPASLAESDLVGIGSVTVLIGRIT